MKDKSRNFGVLKAGMVMLLFLTLIYSGTYAYVKGFGLVDLNEYWRNMAYAIRGYNVSFCIEEGIVLENVGAVGGDIVMPWGKLLGNLIYPGFLPYGVVVIYYLLLLCICTGLAGWYISGWIREKEIRIWESRDNILFSVCLLVMPFYWIDVFCNGNWGGAFCIFLMLAAFFIEKNPWIASLLLAMAMIKPQNAALFLLVVLAKKKFKIVCQTVGVIIAGWAGTEVYMRIWEHFRETGTRETAYGSVAAIIKGYSGNGKGAEGGVPDFFMYGILDKLVDLGVSSYVALIGSALLGILFVLFVMFYIRNCKTLSEDWVVLFSIAALGSVFWSYKTPCDEVIVVLCNLLCILYWKYGEHDLKEVIWLLFYLVCINMRICYIWGKIFGDLERNTSVVFDQVLRIIVYISMIIQIKRRCMMEEKRCKPDCGERV